MNNTKKKKVLLLGWDAADWKIINPLIDQGLMPNMKKLVEGGVIGNLATLDPAYSPMLWSSIATGKRPYKHGVLGFHEPWDKGNGIRPVMGTTRKTKAIWNMLTQKEYKTHVVGWWPSHPTEPINGVMISDLFGKPTGKLYEPWPLAENSVHPKGAADFFASLRVHPEELTGSHLNPFIPNGKDINQSKDKRPYSIARETSIAASLHNAFTNIIRTKEWDFAAIYLATIDHYCHGFMKYHPPKRAHIPHADYEMYKDVVTAGYRFHDMMLGRIMDLIDEQTYLMLVSDHGFQPDHLRPRSIPNEPAGPAYEHSPYGIFVLSGPDIKKDEIIYGASLLDVTPTLLTCLDLPVGEDMDGKILTQVFDVKKEITSIESWDTLEGFAGMHKKETAEDENIAAQALEQLVELGYIDKPSDNKEKNYKTAKDECDFNLARAYINGGLVHEALPLLEQLYQENPDTPRFAFKLATSYQQMGELKKCRTVINALREKEFYNSATLDVMEGSLLLGERQPLKAIKLFKKAEQAVNPFHSRLNMQIAQAYKMLGRWEDAERAIQRDLEIDYDNAQAHSILGQIYLSDNRFEKALESLLQAVGLEYESPNAHYYIGEALYKLGKYQEAAQAYELVLTMVPQANMARSKLVELYKQHLQLPEKASAIETAFEQKLKGTITVVSGLPRSGTSMMMQMLQKGGMPIFTDEQRSADDNNPKGYLEHEAVKSLQKNKQWLVNANEKAVKIIANLLVHLPLQYHYKIIFMERDLSEVVNSQRKMLNRLGKQTKNEVYPFRLVEEYQRTLEKTKQWASRHANVEVIYIPYAEVVEKPFEQALLINEFLDYQLLPELMVQAVEIDLYREKATAIQLVMKTK